MPITLFIDDSVRVTVRNINSASDPVAYSIDSLVAVIAPVAYSLRSV